MGGGTPCTGRENTKCIFLGGGLAWYGMWWVVPFVVEREQIGMSTGRMQMWVEILPYTPSRLGFFPAAGTF